MPRDSRQDNRSQQQPLLDQAAWEKLAEYNLASSISADWKCFSSASECSSRLLLLRKIMLHSRENMSWDGGRRAFMWNTRRFLLSCETQAVYFNIFCIMALFSWPLSTFPPSDVSLINCHNFVLYRKWNFFDMSYKTILFHIATLLSLQSSKSNTCIVINHSDSFQINMIPLKSI